MGESMDIDYRLDEWANWSRSDIGIGYPSSSAHTKAYEGGYGTKQGIDMPKHIEEVDKALTSLLGIDPMRYEAIKRRYYDNVAEQHLGKKMKIPRDKAKKLLASAVGFVEALLI